MTPDTFEMFKKLLDFIRDSSEYKSMPIHEVINVLGLLKAKLEHDMFKKLDVMNEQKIDSFLKELK